MNFELVEGIGKRFVVTLSDADGNPLNAADYVLTGGAEVGNRAKVDMTAQQVDTNRVQLTLPGLYIKPGSSGLGLVWHYQLRATELSTGTTWLLIAGKITVRPWCGATEAQPDTISPGTVELEALLSAETVEVDVTMTEGTPGRDAYELRYAQFVPSVLASAYVYDLGVMSADVDLSGLSFAESANTVQTAELWLSCGSTVYGVTWPSSAVWLTAEPALESGTAYRFAVRQEPSGKLVISAAYEYTV